MPTNLDQKLSPDNAALITIDVQNDFCNPESPPAKLYGRDVSMHLRMIDGLLELVARGARGRAANHPCSQRGAGLGDVRRLE